jgi:hypothetical protein
VAFAGRLSFGALLKAAKDDGEFIENYLASGWKDTMLKRRENL